jgi:hypothetical protein
VSVHIVEGGVVGDDDNLTGIVARSSGSLSRRVGRWLRIADHEDGLGGNAGRTPGKARRLSTSSSGPATGSRERYAGRAATTAEILELVVALARKFRPLIRSMWFINKRSRVPSRCAGHAFAGCGRSLAVALSGGCRPGRCGVVSCAASRSRTERW